MILLKGGKHKAYMLPDRMQRAIKPDHPLPAIPVKVGYQPEHPMQMYPSAYIYVCSDSYLMTFFKRWGLVEERR